MASRASAWVRSIVALGLLCYPMAAHATQATFTNPFDLTPAQATFVFSNDDGNVTNQITNPPTFSQLLTFTQFDPSLGALNSVTISYTTSFGGTSTVKTATITSGDGIDPDKIDFFADGTLAFLLSGAGLITNQSSTPPTITATCLNADVPCTNKSSSASGNFNGNTSGLGGPSFAPFVGTGSFDLTTSLSSTLAPRTFPDNGTNPPDNTTFEGSFDGHWSGSVSVVYDYTARTPAVPSPLTLYLLVGGLGGIALLRRRRR